MVTGSCLCGEIAFEADEFGEYMGHCHCSMCRKHHGAAFVTYVSAPRDAFAWVRGEDNIARYNSSPGMHRQFCPKCGSSLPLTDPDWPDAHIPAGMLDHDCGLRPEAHVFVGSKLNWYAIRDGLPQFDTLPPGAGESIEVAPRGGREGVLAGSCLCGAVTFELDRQPDRIMNCHCTRCRKSRGAAHATNLFIDGSAFRFVTGEDHVQTYRLPDAERFGTSFCRTCGSQTPSRWSGLSGALIPAGAMDDDLEGMPHAHIFVGNKAPWFEIADDLPQFEARPQH